MEAQVEQVPPTPQEAAAPAQQQPAAKAAAPKKEKKAQAPKPEEPEWIKHRIALWDELKKNQSAHEGS
jgi:hypothetical protein